MNCRLLIIFVLFFLGCSKCLDVEPYVEVDSQLFECEIESVSDKVVGATRATSIIPNVDRGYIFFYNSVTGNYKGCEAVADLSLTQSGSKIKFTTSTDYSTKDKIIAIFNHDISAGLPSDFSKVTSENIGEYFPLSADYLSSVNGSMPMYLNDFTDSDRAVREVYRSVARMELFIKDGLAIDHDSHTHSIGKNNLKFVVVNAISQGAVGGTPTITEKCFDVTKFDDNFPYTLTEYVTSTDDTDNKIYLYPFSYAIKAINGSKLKSDTYSNDRFAIILKHDDTIYGDTQHEPRYYKLNLLDKATSTYFDIKPNHNYRVVIKAVNSRGYATVEEAYEMPPSNIEYEIYDDKGGLTYSNGQYAISMDEILSYDEVLVYGEKETTLEFNNIRYALPDGGEMAGSKFITNEVVFKVYDVKNTTTNSWIDPNYKFEVETISDFDFDSEGRSALTSVGKSIKMTLKNAGECKIKLKIKLGNLEIGRDEITIKKVATDGNGDGSFDAHPNHFEIAGKEFIEGSWQSDDIDFGARASSAAYDECGDGGMVIYMGENATPTGYKTMNGAVSGKSSKNSYPVFSPKTRKGYYSYRDDNGEHKVMIQVKQLAPFYLGHFGNTASSQSLYHYNGLVCEKIEEIKGGSGPDANGQWVTSLLDINGVMKWSENQKQYYTGTIWGDYNGLGDRYHNLVDGLGVTENIVKNNSNITLEEQNAAYYCYMKNDINGNGTIDSNEPIKWYLPAQNQVLAMWVNMNVFQSDIKLFRLNNGADGESRPYYWSCSEMDDNGGDFVYSFPADFSSHAMAFNMLEGQAEYVPKNSGDPSGQAHVRCVRELE